MKSLTILISVLALLLSANVASAQVSRDVAESAVDEDVRIEMSDGRAFDGRVLRAGESTLILRVRSGRLIEIEREQIADVFVNEAELAPTERDAIQAPGGDYGAGGYLGPHGSYPNPEGSAFVTEEEYLYARSQYYPARRLRFFGVAAAAVGTAALAAGIGTRVGYNNSYCDYDYYADDDYYDGYGYGCNEGLRKASVAMFTLFPILVGGGMTMSIIGGKKKSEFGPTLIRYRRQQQAERQRTVSEHSDESLSKPSAEFAVSPTFNRDGGGLRLNVTF